MDTNLVIPLDVDHCRVIFDFYFNDISEAGRAYNTQSIAVGDRVQAEDLGICEDVQRGLKSRAYGAGRLSVRREAGEQLFHRLLAADLRRGLGHVCRRSRLTSTKVRGTQEGTRPPLCSWRMRREKPSLFRLCRACCALIASAQVTAVKAGRLSILTRARFSPIRSSSFATSRLHEVGKRLGHPAGAKVIDLSADDGAARPDRLPYPRCRRPGRWRTVQRAAEICFRRSFSEPVTNASKMLESGFTTVRDVGIYRALNDVALRDAIAQGDIVAAPACTSPAPTSPSPAVPAP